MDSWQFFGRGGLSGMGQSKGGEDVDGHPVASVLQTPAFLSFARATSAGDQKGMVTIPVCISVFTRLSLMISPVIGAWLPDFTPYMQINTRVHQKARAYMGPEQQPYMGVFRAVPL